MQLGQVISRMPSHGHDREVPIAAALPSGLYELEGKPVHPEQILVCETEVYGLISGPSWLRQSLVSDLEELGYVRNYYDKCVMTLPAGSHR